MYFKDLNNMNMTAFIAKLGYFPVCRKRNSFWYMSMLREPERTPSFRVTTYKGMDYFKDFGTNISGNMVDFCLLFFHLNEKELFHKINTEPHLFSFDQQINFEREAFEKKKDLTNNYQVSVHELRNSALLHYLRKRGIYDASIIDEHLKELHVKYSNGKGYFMIGFPNLNGGWAVRNKYYKGALGHQGTSLIKGNSGLQKLVIVEGFMDGLSIRQIEKQQPDMLPKDIPGSDILVLNSTNNVHFTKDILPEYHTVFLLLDNDPTGQKCTQTVLELLPRAQDIRNIMGISKDVNEWLQSIPPKQRNRQIRI